MGKKFAFLFFYGIVLHNDVFYIQDVVMNHHEIYTREGNESYENVPRLPVYLRSIGRKRLENGYREEAPELHSPFFEMIWCVRGVGEVFLYKEAFPMFPNDIFFYYPNERHVLHSLSESWEMYWVAFDGPSAVSFFDGYGYPRKMHSAEPCPIELFDEIRCKIGDSSPVTFRSMLALLCRLLALAGGADKSDSDPVRIALELIRKNLTNPGLDVNYLAEQLQMHRSTVTELFKKRLGRLPGQAIRDRRIHTAEALLRGTVLPVREIAKRCGIPDESSFCRFFQHNCGMTPLQYRRKEK